MTYTDGTKATLDQEAHDVTTFLAYAANPDLDQRHRLGVKICLFLIFMTGHHLHRQAPRLGERPLQPGAGTLASVLGSGRFLAKHRGLAPLREPWIA